MKILSENYTFESVILESVKIESVRVDRHPLLHVGMYMPSIIPMYFSIPKKAFF